jgi:hypothetical protein
VMRSSIAVVQRKSVDWETLLAAPPLQMLAGSLAVTSPTGYLKAAVAQKSTQHKLVAVSQLVLMEAPPHGLVVVAVTPPHGLVMLAAPLPVAVAVAVVQQNPATLVVQRKPATGYRDLAQMAHMAHMARRKGRVQAGKTLPMPKAFPLVAAVVSWLS